MIKSTVVGLIKMRLGNRTDTDIDARIDAELDASQYELERFGVFTPWFLLSTETSYTLTAGVDTVSIPTDMLQEYEEGALYYEGLPLLKHDQDYLSEKFHNAEPGAPVAYALVNDVYQVFPTPDIGYSLTNRYYQMDTVPSLVASDAENKWMKHAADWLLAKTGMAIARFIKDAEALARFAEDEDKASKRVYLQHIDRAERNSPRKKGDV